mmetsp:Transcript_130540/g.279015  ORF Transcript_130540/g.279015 Transcript_130540/m.279015 type:complete len:454 (+) Transcript_130540:448-1809(+)
MVVGLMIGVAIDLFLDVEPTAGGLGVGARNLGRCAGHLRHCGHRRRCLGSSSRREILVRNDRLLGHVYGRREEREAIGDDVPHFRTKVLFVFEKAGELEDDLLDVDWVHPRLLAAWHHALANPARAQAFRQDAAELLALSTVLAAQLVDGNRLRSPIRRSQAAHAAGAAHATHATQATSAHAHAIHATTAHAHGSHRQHDILHVLDEVHTRPHMILQGICIAVRLHLVQLGPDLGVEGRAVGAAQRFGAPHAGVGRVEAPPGAEAYHRGHHPVRAQLCIEPTGNHGEVRAREAVRDRDLVLEDAWRHTASPRMHSRIAGFAASHLGGLLPIRRSELSRGTDLHRGECEVILDALSSAVRRPIKRVGLVLVVEIGLVGQDPEGRLRSGQQINLDLSGAHYVIAVHGIVERDHDRNRLELISELLGNVVVLRDAGRPVPRHWRHRAFTHHDTVDH